MLAGGDQMAESLANVGKRELRRCNLLFNDSKDTIDHRNLLAAHYLNKGPGFETGLESSRDFSRRHAKHAWSHAMISRKHCGKLKTERNDDQTKRRADYQTQFFFWPCKCTVIYTVKSTTSIFTGASSSFEGFCSMKCDMQKA